MLLPAADCRRIAARRLLLSRLVSLVDTPKNDKAILARVEQIVDLLRTRYVREGWKMDEDGAACTLAYWHRPKRLERDP
jgi:hypothetical protein